MLVIVHWSEYRNRRDTDAQNDWARMECTVGVVGDSQDLIADLVSHNGSFSEILPMVNGSSLVIGGEFSFSSNGS